MIKKLLVLAAGAGLCTSCAGLFTQTPVEVVDPVGPITIAPNETQTTVTTTSISGSVVAEGDGTSEEMTGQTEMSGGAINSSIQSDEVSMTGTVTATGATATMVDPNTGETMTVTAGIPAAIPGAVVTQTTTVNSSYECGMSLDSHGELLQALRNNPYPDPQIELVKSVASTNQITADQAVAIIRTINGEMTREEVAVIMYPVICDQNNWFKIYNYVGPVTADSIRERLGQK